MKGLPVRKGGEPVFSVNKMGILERHIEKAIRRLQAQPLLLILVAMFFMGGMMKRARPKLPAWAVQSL